MWQKIGTYREERATRGAPLSLFELHSVGQRDKKHKKMMLNAQFLTQHSTDSFALELGLTFVCQLLKYLSYEVDFGKSHVVFLIEGKNCIFLCGFQSIS